MRANKHGCWQERGRGHSIIRADAQWMIVLTHRQSSRCAPFSKCYRAIQISINNNYLKLEKSYYRKNFYRLSVLIGKRKFDDLASSRYKYGRSIGRIIIVLSESVFDNARIIRLPRQKAIGRLFSETIDITDPTDVPSRTFPSINRDVARSQSATIPAACKSLTSLSSRTILKHR